MIGVFKSPFDESPLAEGPFCDGTPLSGDAFSRFNKARLIFDGEFLFILTYLHCLVDMLLPRDVLLKIDFLSF